MDRNKHVTTSLTLPALTHLTEQTGYFSAGDVNLGTQPTVPTADWCNGITEEIRNVIVSAGITPSRSDLTQLQQAIGLNAVKPNLLDNAGFQIWQRGTSLAAGTGTRFLADRWAVESVGETVAVTQGVFTPGQTAVAGNPQYYHSATIASTAAAGNYALVSQKVLNVSQSAGGTITVGFKAKLSTPGSIAVELSQNFGSGGSAQVDIAPVTISLTGSWAFYTATFTVPSITGKTLGIDDINYLHLKFWVSAGSTYNTRTNSLGQKSVTFDLAQVQLVDGSNMAGWVEPNYLIEKQKALQFFEKGVMEGDSTAGAGGSAFTHSSWVPFVAPKVKVPTISQINNLTRFFTLKSGTATIGSSPDAINYYTKIFPISASWTCAAASPISHIAVVLSNGINYVTSNDGITWTARTMPSSQNWSCISVHPTTGLFVAIAYNSNVFATSPDGITWTSRTMPSVSNWAAIDYCLISDIWFVTSATSQNTGVNINAASIASAPTTSASMVTSQPYPYILSVNTNSLLAITGTSTGGGANLSWSASGGTSWASCTNGFVTTGTITSAAAKYGSVAVALVGGVVKYSNGLSVSMTWSTATTVPGGHTWVYVTFNDDKFLMYSPSTGGYATSPDGNIWTICTFTGTTGGTGLTQGNLSFAFNAYGGQGNIGKGVVGTNGYTSTRNGTSGGVQKQWSEQWTADAEI